MKKITLTLLSAVVMLTAYGQSADTTIVLNYGEMGPVDTITVSKSSATFKQLQEAETLIKGITNKRVKNKTVMSYILSNPDSDGSIYLLNHLRGSENTKKCLAAMSEKTRNGVMKKLYDIFAEGMKRFDELTAPTAEACQIGKEATDFTLEDIGGKPLTLSSFRGKYVMLDFWGSWCGNCIAAYPEIKAFYEQHRDKLEILGVAFHDKKDVWIASAKEHELPWKLVLDTDGENSVASRYGIVAAPTYVFIDPEGKVVNWDVGAHETIVEYFE